MSTLAAMRAMFTRRGRSAAPDTSALGAAVIAMPVHPDRALPAGCGLLAVDSQGRTRRAPEGSRLQLAPFEVAWAYHPGPYTIDLAPFAAAPEVGLQVCFAVDSVDPRVAQQRFDLFLASEAQGPLALAHFCQTLEAALQRELAQGNLALPPCTSLVEWNAFRAGFNQLLYMRFGVVVEECVPVDLGESVDFAAMLMARTIQASPADPEPAPRTAAASAAPAPLATAPDELSDEFSDALSDALSDKLSDALALRRLFLELPCVMCALRLAVLPPGQLLFRRHQDLLRRLDLVSLAVSSMPALDLAAPGMALAQRQQLRRIGHSRRAVAALDEAWGLLARIRIAGAPRLEELFDDCARIVANLEYDLGERRMASCDSAPA